MIAVNRIHEIDALEGLARLPPDSVDLVVTDPPYNIASKSKLTIRDGKIVSTAHAWGAWDTFHPFDYDLLIGKVISECHRVLKAGGALYMFTSRENNGFFVRRALERGFVYRNQVVMVKKNPLPSFSKTNWRSAFEVAFYVTKGKPSVFNFPQAQADAVNVFTYATRQRETDHPTEKPLELIRRMVLASSNPGDLVCDPFMGSGTTALAATQTGRRFIGFETCREYLAMADERLHSAEGARRAA